MHTVRPLVHRELRWLSLVCDAVLGKSQDSINDRIRALEHRTLIDESLARQLQYLVSVRDSCFHDHSAKAPDFKTFAGKCNTARAAVVQALSHRSKSIDWQMIDRDSQKTNVDDVDLVVDGIARLEQLLTTRFGTTSDGIVSKLRDARNHISNPTYAQINIAVKIHDQVIHDDVALTDYQRREFEGACYVASDGCGEPSFGETMLGITVTSIVAFVLVCVVSLLFNVLRSFLE